MSDLNNANPEESKQTAEKRKQDHISLSFQSNTGVEKLDDRFYYEPMLAAFPSADREPFTFLSKKMKYPLWISSMTGGSEFGKKINHNLARAAGKYGLGMGLGSCRGLLYSDDYFEDFNVRSLIGDQPLYANLGIAQISYLLANQEESKITEMINKLQADGLIIHINPLQEYMQKEGDQYNEAPILTVKKVMDKIDTKFIVKEVGQGMGIESIRALLSLPIEALDLAAFGGTNFAKLEQLRSNQDGNIDPIAYVGHSIDQMLEMIQTIMNESSKSILCKQLIVSGGVKSYLDGYYHINKSPLPAIYGQASEFLKYAKSSYEDLELFLESQIKGYRMAELFLKVK